jgi:hypothetical protein
MDGRECCMVKYKKKPVVVEARQCTLETTPTKLAKWCGGRAIPMGNGKVNKGWVEIKTLEGVMIADFGDYIIKGVQGEFYPCKPDIFEMTYDKVEE